MIRSSSHSLKFTNKHKKEEIINFIEQYKSIVSKYINIIWNQYTKNTPSMLESKICNQIKTNISNDSRIRQCAAKQACSMVKACFDKQNKRLYKLTQLQREGKNTKYLQRKIDLFSTKKPSCDNINVELDPRFIDTKQGKHFDLFIKIKQIGNKRSINIPIKYTKVSNKWLNQGKLKNSIRLTKNKIILFFEIEKSQIIGNRKVGADQGLITTLSLSDNQVTKKCNHGHDLDSICRKLSNKKKGSKAFRRVVAHRKNYINWSLKQLNFKNINELVLEKIVNIRKGKSCNRKLSHWTYTLIKDKLIMLSETEGFKFIEQDNKFRSQRCSQCGWTHKSNRLGKTFKCQHCDFYSDSDLNAASNHEVLLVDLPQRVWHEHINRTIGFYWLKDRVVYDQECIVPGVKERM